MNIPEINYWAVLVAAVAGVVVGAIWYARGVMGKRWAKLAHVDKRNVGNPAMAVITLAILSFITAWVLAGASSIAWHFYDGSYLSSALVTAVALWAGFTAARLITHDAMEGRSSSLTIINIAHELITVLVMAVIIGVWPPVLM